MRLVQYEFRKFFTRFHVIFIAVLLILNILLTALQYREMFGKEYREFEAVKNEMLWLYSSDRDTYEQIYAEHMNKVSEYNESRYSDMFSANSKTLSKFENEYVDSENYGDIKLFSEIDEIIHTNDSCKQKINAVLKDAVLRLEESDEDGYTSRYYIALCSHYMPLAEKELYSEEVRGWNEYFSLKTPTVLLAIALIGALCDTFTSDRRAGMSNILHISKYGERASVRSKLIFISCASSVLTVIFTCTPLFVFLLSSGLSSVNHPVQMLTEFSYCPYDLTVLQFFFIYLLLKIVFFTLFALSAAVINQIFENDKIGLAFAAVIWLSGTFMSKIQPSSRYYFLQKFSVVELFNVNILFTRYRGLNIFGQCVNYTYFVILLLPIIAAVIVLLSILHKTSGIREFGGKEVKSGKAGRTMSLLKSEFFKQLVCTRYVYIVLAAIVLKCVICGIYFRPYSNYTEAQYIDYIAGVRGEITEEKLKKISDEEEYIKDSIANYETAGDDYRNGLISEEEYEKCRKSYYYAEYCKNACDKLCKQRDYLIGIRESYPEVEFIYYEGVERYFSSPLDIAAAAVLPLLGSNVFSCEYESGFSKIMRVSKKGRVEIFRTKIMYSALMGIILYLAFFAVSMFFLMYYYDIDFWTVPIQSIPGFSYVTAEMSIAEYMILYQCISLIGFMLLFMFTASMSAISGGQLKAIIVSAFVILTAYYIGNMAHGLPNYAGMLTPQNISKDAVSYAACAIVTVFGSMAIYIKWCGREYKK
ncbi:MAG: hypothetical protein ACI4XJ_03135 [Eubacteriales bacterium]